jgi:hypothetical protein
MGATASSSFVGLLNYLVIGFILLVIGIFRFILVLGIFRGIFRFILGIFILCVGFIVSFHSSRATDAFAASFGVAPTYDSCIRFRFGFRFGDNGNRHSNATSTFDASSICARTVLGISLCIGISIGVRIGIDSAVVGSKVDSSCP